MFKFDRKIWGIKVRKVVIASLLLPLFTFVSAPQAKAAPACVENTDFSRLSAANAATVIYRFTNTGAECTYTLPGGLSSASILAVGGGGGGGPDGGAGGGGGELRYHSSQSLSGILSIDVWVGSGGRGGTWGGGEYNGANGTASTIKWGGSTRYQANGGTGAGGWSSNGPPGGAGGSGGSGGNASSNGQAGGNGPSQVCQMGTSPTGTTPSNSISGSSVDYGGGGGGGMGSQTNNAGSGYLGRPGGGTSGGRGANYKIAINNVSAWNGASAGQVGTVNTGGGGGGGAACDAYGSGNGTNQRTAGGTGAAGVVIISFARFAQTITFASIPDRKLRAGSFTLAPTSSSGLTVALTSATAAVCTVSGMTVTPVSVGTCTLNANQAGNNNHTAATQVQQSFSLTSTEVTYSLNDGSGTTASQTISTTGNFNLRANTFTRSGFRFLRWDSSAAGTGVSYTNSQSVSISDNTTLYAIWSSFIQYNGNSPTSTRTIESTTAISTTATTTLSTGRLARGTPISSGLVLNLDAADSSTVSASTWTNKVSGGTSATIIGSPTYSASEGAFILNGSSQYFDLGDSAFGFTGTANYTINIAFKNNEPMKDTAIFTRHNAGVAGNYIVRNYSGKYLIQREVSPWEIYSNNYVDPSLINYVSAVYNGSTLSVYVNGVADGSVAMTGSVYSSTIKTLIGARLSLGSTTGHLNGKIYSAQVYNRALSASEIATNYQALIPENQVNKTNFTLAGWSTEPSAGTTVAGSVTDLAALPTPYLRLLPANYNAVSKVWTATNGSGAGLTYTGTPVYNSAGGGNFGATKTFPTVSGPTTAGIRLNNPTLKTYTLCVVARYKDANGVAGTQGRLIGSATSNWFSGFYNNAIRQFHHDAWNYDGGTTDLNWHYYCDSGNKAIWDGVKTPTWTYRDTTSLPPLAINWDYYGQNSDWELAEMIVYDQFLSDSAIDNLGRYFKNRYGIVAGTDTSVAAGGIATVTDYASAGDATLYAVWGSRITYEGNLQTTGTPPSTHLITGVSGTLATNTGTLAKAGYKFAGWNTAANGSGTYYAAGATYPNTGNAILYAQYSKLLTFPTQYSYVDPLRLNPYMRFKAADYNASSKVWVDSSGNNRSTSTISGSPSVITTSLGKGNTKTFSVVSGTTAERIRFNNPFFSNGNYTLVTVARYSGASKARIFDGLGYNWLHGFWSGSSGIAFHNGWVTASSSVVHGDNWLIGASFQSNYRSNGVSRGSSGGEAWMPPMTINYGDHSAERSNFEVAEVLIFDYKLTPAQLAQVEDYLSQTYGIALASPGSYPTSQSVAIGAGVGGRSDTLTAVDGFSTKTFSTTPLRSGFSLDTSTANGVALVVSPTVASGTYSQNIIATDSLGETATYLLNVTVTPAVKFDTSTATTVITTHRKGATLRLNTVNGVGTKVFTMTSAATGLTLDTSTAASGFATLRVDTFTAPGTYTQVITVTDDTKIKSTYSVTITINGPPTLSSISAITTSPVLDSLRLNLDTGDQASYSGSGSTWTDLSGNSRNGTLVSSPTFSTANGGILSFNGSSQYATVSSVRSELFTVEAWVKFNSLNNNYACVVTNQYSSDKINYAICFWGNSTIRAGYHQSASSWVGGTTGAFTPVIGTWYQLVYKVEKSGSNYIGTLFVNGTAISGTTTSTIAPNNDQLVDRIGLGWNSGVYINGSIPVVRIYSRALSGSEITQNYNALLPRFTNNPTNQVTITTTESVTAASSIYYAGLGTGNKTFAISNPTSGISIDTATANTVRVNLANNLSATSATVSRSVSQVISATDASGVAAATPVYLTTVINPRINIAASTPLTLSTTFGKTAFDTFTATYGTGTKTFTGLSSDYASAFVVTNPSSNVGLLTVANNLPVGTYTETITATDSVGAITNYVLTVVVNPAPTIAGSPSNALATTLGRAASLRVNVVGGSGNRVITWTSPAAGITIDTSTVAAQNYLTMNVSAAVFASTYTFSLTATDSMSVQATGSFTVTVNKWPRIANPTTVSGGLKIHLDAGNGSSYSGSGTTWTDLSGSGKNGTWQQTPTYKSASGGSLAMGSTTSQYMLSAGLGATNVLTAEAWVKFNAIPTFDNCIVSDKYTPSYINFSICFRNDSKIYGGYWNSSRGWVSTTGTATPLINTWYHFAYTVSLSGSTYTSILYQNGVAVGSPVTSAVAPSSSSTGFLVGTNWRADTKVIDGDISIVRVYSKALTSAEVQQNYNAEGFRFISTNSGTDSATVTQGVAGSIIGVVATEGTGTKRFTITNANAGLTIDTSTANAFTLNLANTLTSTSATVARTITETVTATDSASATTTRVYTITVNPLVRVESTTGTITTTSGIVAWDTFTATQGTGAKTFALTGTPSISGFTLTQSNNQALLKVEPTVNPGTYTLTITVTDAVGAVTSITKTVIVNPRPTITGNTSVAGTRGYTFNSPNYSASGGTGNLTFSITTAPAIPGGNTSGIKLSSTTGLPTIIVESTTVVDTYTVTLRVTDSLTAFTTLIVTLRVNPPVTLTGSLSLSKVYGEELSQVYTTGGGTAPFNIFATTICTSEKSTYVGNGTNGTLDVTYTVERFSGVGNCDWVAPTNVTSASVLVVAGGGAGGTRAGGGGGAGGYQYVAAQPITAGTTYAVAVGAGGTGVLLDSANNGGDSQFGSLAVVKGGGGGGGAITAGITARSGKNGGSGGGAAGYTNVQSGNIGLGTLTQGNNGGSPKADNSWPGGGGGGSSGVGATPINNTSAAGKGGAGTSNLITGTSLCYATGGGAGTLLGSTAGAAGDCGGAASPNGGAGTSGSVTPTNPTPNTGAGGGGSGWSVSADLVGGNGASGVVIVRYVTPAIDSETTKITMDTLSLTPTGSLRLNAPRNVPVGTYTQSITVKDSASTPATTSATVTLTVTKATPTVALSLPGSVTTAKYGNPVTISAIASTAGNVAFKNASSNITACTAVATSSGVATCSWTPTAVGATTLKATLTPTDTSNYNNSNEVTFSITVARADTLTVTVLSQTETFTGTAVPATSAFTTTGLAAIDSLTAIAMLFAGTANDGNAYSSSTAPTNAGTYSVTPNYPTNAAAFTFGVGSAGTTSAITNYESFTVVAGNLTVKRKPQTMSFTFANSNTVTYSPTATLASTATTRLGTGTRTYSSTTPINCSISDTAVVTVLQAGSCGVAMGVALTANYEADTATATITINKAPRTLTLTPGIATLKFADTTTVVTTLSGGAADGTISYTLGSPAGCAFDPLTGELTALSGTIQCPLTARITEGVNYLSETSTAISLTIARANAPVITIDSITALSHTPGVRALVTPTFSVTGLKNSNTANSLTYTYSFVSNPFETFAYSNTQTPIDAGTYSITPSALTLSSGLISNYETPTYAASVINFVINRINQESLTVENTNGEIEVPFALTPRGGTTNGAISFTKISGDYCSVSGSNLTATQAGNCVITVTMAGSRNYLSITSETITVRIRNYVLLQFNTPDNSNSGIKISSSVPLTKDVDICTSGCVPTIASSDVFEGSEGDLIILTGTNFTSVTKLYFNIYTEAPTFVADSDTQLSVRIPAGLPLGDTTIEVVSPGGRSNRYFDFAILP